MKLVRTLVYADSEGCTYTTIENIYSAIVESEEDDCRFVVVYDCSDDKYIIIPVVYSYKQCVSLSFYDLTADSDTTLHEFEELISETLERNCRLVEVFHSYEAINILNKND